MVKNTPEDIISDVDITASDGGSAVGSYFKFQDMCVSLIALKMISGQTQYDELFCELYEDAIGITKNKKFVGIQVKYDESNSMSLKNDKICHTLKKFSDNNEKYPNKFEKFILMTNAEIKNSPKLKNIINHCLRSEKNEEIEKYVLDLAKKCEISSQQLKNILIKLEVEKVPNKEFLFAHLIAIAGNDVKPCKSKNPFQIKSIIESLINLVSEKSQDIPNSFNEYFSFLENSQIKKIHARILSKRLTSDEISSIIEKSETFVLLKSDTVFPNSIGSIDLIDYKMKLGGIHQSAIQTMQKLTTNAFHHFFEKQYDEPTDELESQLMHLSSILETINSDADTKARLAGNLFGLNKLDQISSEINKIYTNRPEHVFYKSPEILRGLMGLLVMECTVNFSNMPEEGFV